MARIVFIRTSSRRTYKNFITSLDWKLTKVQNKKVLLSPHAATFTKECTSNMAIQTAQNIIDFFENKLNKLMIVKL